MSAQLSLLETPSDRILTAEQAGLVDSLPPGPERLLGAMVRRGLQPEDYLAAARMVLAWNDLAPLDDEDDGACRAEALRAREASTRSQPSGKSFVTVAEAPTASTNHGREAT